MSILPYISCAISIACLAVSVFIGYRARRIRADFDKRLEMIEMSIVRSVMEENPALADKMVENWKSMLISGGYFGSPDKALQAVLKMYGRVP